MKRCHQVIFNDGVDLRLARKKEMFVNIEKKDGSLVEFDTTIITEKISAVGKKTGEYDERDAKKLTLRVLTLAHELHLGKSPKTWELEEITERVLLDSPFYQTARQFIIDNARSIYIKAINDQFHRSKQTQIVKCIEFPPEYIQSGVSILSYFARILHKRCPDQKAKISIEQDGLIVKLIIDPIDGEGREIIERELTEYELVITGKKSLAEYTDDKLLALEMKTEVRLAHARIQSQSDIIDYQKADIMRLNSLLEKAIITNPQKPHIVDIDVNVPVTTAAFSENNQYAEIPLQIELLSETSNKLVKQIDKNSSLKPFAMEIQKASEQIGNNSSRDEIAKSNGLVKLRDFLENVEKVETTAGKLIATVKDGVNIVRKMAGYYNKIAQWCGLSQVPEPFVK